MTNVMNCRVTNVGGVRHFVTALDHLICASDRGRVKDPYVEEVAYGATTERIFVRCAMVLWWCNNRTPCDPWAS